MKACSVCGEAKPLGEFSKNRTRPDGLRRECKSCARAASADYYRRHKGRWDEYRQRRGGDENRAYMADYRQRNLGRIRATEMLRKYGITVEQYDAILESQGGVCAICSTDAPGGRGSWHIDHDHACCPGKQSCGECVRGLLCNTCNVGLGMFRDSHDLLQGAANYLAKTCPSGS